MMRRRRLFWRCLWSALLLASLPPAIVNSVANAESQDAAAQDATLSPRAGMAHLQLRLAGDRLTAEVVAAAVSLLGFAHPPRTAEERHTLGLATENLTRGDAMIRFNTHAECRLEDATLVEALDAVPRPLLRAQYCFRCARPERLESAALGLFAGFPALERVLVQYQLPDGSGGAELTPGNPVVTFVPF